MNGNCINSDKVPQVFDSYEEALIQATAQNDELFKNENSIDIDDNIENYNEFNFGVEDNSNYQNELIGTQKEDNPYEENKSSFS